VLQTIASAASRRGFLNASRGADVASVSNTPSPSEAPYTTVFSGLSPPAHKFATPFLAFVGPFPTQRERGSLVSGPASAKHKGPFSPFSPFSTGLERSSSR
jgi:hypothetical protein